MSDDQREVLSFLATPAAHGGAAPVERIDTHGAHVFLAGESAIKIKRAVRYDYVDLSTLKRRRDMLLRELELNGPVAPSLYRDVAPLTRAPDGGLEWNGPGDAVEWALRMRRFPREAELEVMAEEGRINDALAESLGREIARYHARAPRREVDGAALIAEILDELDRVFAGMAGRLGAGALSRFAVEIRAAFASVEPLLRRRARAGFVRRCHGDLHLRNLVMIEGRPVPFDALEFDERLGTCDVLYDLAFLIMDLEQRGLPRAANLCFNAYLSDDPDSLAGLSALPLFLSVRAAIRAMVEIQKNAATGSGEDAEGRAYLDAALAYLSPPPPCLVGVGGFSGSGKTTLARHLAPRLGPAPGAVHLRSDVERKRLLGVAPNERLPKDTYDATTSERVYAVIRDKAAQVLLSGHGAILDAAHLNEDQRDATEALAGVHPFLGIWFEASPEELKRRVENRRGDASDADADVVALQLRQPTGEIRWRRVETNGSLEATRQRLDAVASTLRCLRRKCTSDDQELRPADEHEGGQDSA